MKLNCNFKLLICALVGVLGATSWAMTGHDPSGLLMAVGTIPLITDEQAKATHKLLRDFAQRHVTALHGMLDKLPEVVRGEMKALHDSLNSELAKMPPIEQVAGAQMAGWALESLTRAVDSVQTYASNLLERMGSMGKEYAGLQTELNGLKDSQKNGALLTKEQAKELVDAAKTEQEKVFNSRIVGFRKSAIELAGLPVPADAILSLPDEQFEAAQKQAVANVAELGRRGLTLKGKGEGFVRSAAWANTTEFAGQIKTIDELLPDAAKRSAADPLLGNGGDKGGDGKQVAVKCGVSLC